MKKSIYILISLSLCAGVLFTSCSFSNPSDKESTEENIDIITEPGVTHSGSADATVPVNNGEVTPSVNTEPSSDESSSEEVTYVGTLVGYTSKNYPISEKDGITYVDGILVANKTYALPESYNPGDLLSECEDAFSVLQNAAANEGLSIWNASGFRSYALQESLYNRYVSRDGQEAADRYSARPGHSEHQTGLAIDLNSITQSFADTREGQWIAENCWRYGFILRYPKGKEAQTGYMYEPWHIRYVGVDAAEQIYNSGLCLEEYYGITSEYSNKTEVTEEEETTASEITEPVTEAPVPEVTEAVSETTTQGMISYG